jgi:outer membrane immunogenic protein
VSTSARCLAIRAPVGIAVVAALLGAPALAADLDIKAPPRPAPVAIWSGPYVGIGVGARFNAVDGSVTAASFGNPPTAIALPPVSEGYSNPLLWWGAAPGAMQYIDNISIGVRGYAGWNVQVAPTYVIGVEADFAYANEQAVFHGSPYPANLLFGTPNTPFGASPYDEFKVRTTWDASARLRAGWLPNPATLLYLTAGLAWAHIEVTSVCSIVPTAGVSNCAPGNYFGGTLSPDVITHSAVQLGWTAGAGVDLLLGSNWVARAQYRFANFGYPSSGPFKPFRATDTRTCNGCSAANTPVTVSYELPVMQHNFEVGIAYKFGP